MCVCVYIYALLASLFILDSHSIYIIAGLMDASNPCCSALLNGTSGCIPLLKPCNNADRHFFWDGYHQTEAVYSLVASRCITDSSVCVPFTLNKLLNMWTDIIIIACLIAIYIHT